MTSLSGALLMSSIYWQDLRTLSKIGVVTS